MKDLKNILISDSKVKDKERRNPAFVLDFIHQNIIPEKTVLKYK
ncbi:hypothetical protein V7157_11970 [Neobacillus drentensis]